MGILKNLNGLEDGFTYLLTDTNLSNDIIDLEDVTKVKFDQNGYILDIGKNIEEYNGFDSGIFLCSNEIFDALQSYKEETTLSSAIKILAKKRRVKIVEFNGFWIDIDTKTELKKAEKFLLSNLTKENDGFISKHLNRKVSLFFTKYLVKLNLTPNQISLFSFILSIIGSLVLANNGYLSLLFGGILVQLASIIDGCDGEIARIKYQSSEFGGWFDAVLDRYSDGFILFALTYHQFMIDKSESTLIIGFLAIIGSFVLSYTADKYDKRFKSKFNFRIGRDLRIFTVFVGAVLNLALFTLILIAIVMNIEVIRRILIVKR